MYGWLCILGVLGERANPQPQLISQAAPTPIPQRPSVSTVCPFPSVPHLCSPSRASQIFPFPQSSLPLPLRPSPSFLCPCRSRTQEDTVEPCLPSQGLLAPHPSRSLPRWLPHCPLPFSRKHSSAQGRDSQAGCLLDWNQSPRLSTGLLSPGRVREAERTRGWLEHAPG